MSHPRAGYLAQTEDLINLNSLLMAYASGEPASLKPVSFGTSGHRGSTFKQSFNDAHVAAIVQAIVDYRATNGIMGPLFLGKDTHALSRPAEQTALEVLAANCVETIYQVGDGYTPTPVISRAIIRHNGAGNRTIADGILVTPSHNPPEDGGIKYNLPSGGPADTDATSWIEARANTLMAAGNRDVRRVRNENPESSHCLRAIDFAEAYIEELSQVIDMAAIATSGLKIGVDPLGGAAIAYWPRIAERYGLNLEVVDSTVDPLFAFMSLDHDGKIRMDCSSPPAMARLVALKDRYDIAWGNDADVDRHGIVVPNTGLMNPNHYLAVAIDYLLSHRPLWPLTAKIGKTLVSSNLIDLVVADQGRAVFEVPVGFKWFVIGLLSGKLGFGGEESAGASFLQRDGKVWTTDKDGMILGLLAAEIAAVTGMHPGQHYDRLAAKHGIPCYRRLDSPMDDIMLKAFKQLTPEKIQVNTLAGEKILGVLAKASGNGAAIGGIKVITANGWFAARPSGTEPVYKLYAESMLGETHLQSILADAQALVCNSLQGN